MSRTRGQALELDRAIDAALGRGVVEASAAEDDLGATARLLRDTLPRLHPRFGFEELLAARLTAARDGAPEGRSSEPIPLALRAAAAGSRIPRLVPAGADAARSASPRRSRVAGGAIASGVSLALPLAGAAIVIWRRSRSTGSVL